MKQTVTDIISKIQEEKAAYGITFYDKASLSDIYSVEDTIGVKLPEDIKALYLLCNGFESGEDLFRLLPLNEIIENTRNGPDPHLVEQKDFHIAEYMIYSDMWTVNINREDEGKYTIYNKSGNIVTLTNSLSEFLERFFRDGVFNGLYKWREEIQQADKATK